eukprot:5974571-Amphidinium_carterae.2
MGTGPQRNHRSVHLDDQLTHCLHVDLAGPFDPSVACYHYFAVGALRLPELPLAAPQRQPMRYPERSTSLKQWSLSDSPLVKGECYVCTRIELVQRSLTHNKLPIEFWSFVALYAGQALLCKALQRH